MTYLIERSDFYLRRRMLGAGLLAGLGPVSAQGLLGSAVTSIVSTGAPGSGMDYVARRLAEQFTSRLGGNFPVESMQAAGGVVAASTVLSRPAGSSLLVAHSGLFCTLPLLSAERLAFNPAEDLMPIGIPVGSPVFVITGKTSGIADMAQLRQWRGRPLAYAASLVGASGHIGGQVFLDALRIEPVPVFYSMNRQALLDVSEARVPLGVFGWPAFSGLVDAGRVSVLCVLSEHRAPFAPQVATAKELGIDVNVEGWVGLFSRKGTPESVLQAYALAMNEFLSGPSLAQFLSVGGFSKLDIRRPEAPAFIKRDIDRYAEIIRRYHIGKG